MTTDQPDTEVVSQDNDSDDDSDKDLDQSTRRWRFPSAFTVLFVVTVAVWLLAFVIPTGQYQSDADTGRPIPGSYARVDADLSPTDRAYDLYMAPVNGLYGIQSSETGHIGPYETGDLFGVRLIVRPVANDSDQLADAQRSRP